MALELLKYKATQAGGLQGQLAAILKAGASLEGTRARIVELTAREEYLKAEMASSQDPAAVARLYDELEELEKQTRRDKFLLPAQARAQALALQEQITALLETLVGASNAQSARHSQLVDDMDRRREALEAEEHALRLKWDHARHDAGTGRDLLAEISRATGDELFTVLQSTQARLGGLVETVARAEAEAGSATQKKGA